MAIAKIEFLWYKPGDKIKEEEEIYVDKWTKLGYIDVEAKEIDESVESKFPEVVQEEKPKTKAKGKK